MHLWAVSSARQVALLANHNAMQAYLLPVLGMMGAIAVASGSFVIMHAGYSYMVSSGDPEKLAHAKKLLRNACAGILLIAGAGVITSILMGAYTHAGGPAMNKLPVMAALKPAPVPNGLVDVILKAITGLLSNIVQSVGAPFMNALSYFTTSTPLVADNANVLKLWAVTVGIADSLFVVVIALLGFHVMTYASFGFEELSLKQLLPRIGLVFLLINLSIFIIDGLISFSNSLIHILYLSFPQTTVWSVLSTVSRQISAYGLAALLIMVGFIILSIILLVYYVSRIVTLYLGAVLAPFVLLLWLLPSFKDFSVSAAKAYLSVIFVLFVHVIILQLAASLFSGMEKTSGSHNANPLMALIIGISTLVVLLKAQGVLSQFSYASMGPKTIRKLGGQFLTGMSYVATGRAAES